MKGEALGLRAFIHFDLLRLFGPDLFRESRSRVDLLPDQNGQVRDAPSRPTRSQTW